MGLTFSVNKGGHIGSKGIGAMVKQADEMGQDASCEGRLSIDFAS